MVQRLSATHFKPRPRVAVSSMPSVLALGSLMAEACGRALTRLVPASWRVTLERVEESSFSAAEVQVQDMRFESAAGSLTTQILMDRAAISATIEAMMGGNGAEEAADMGERPLSSIETGTLDVIAGTMGEEISRAFGSHFGREFSFFREELKSRLSRPLEERAVFRFIVNVFGYSGEIGLCMCRHELMHQVDAGAARGISPQDIAAREKLQRQVGKSDVELIVTLGAERLSVEDITNLLPGRMIELTSAASDPVTLWSGGVAAFEGRLARVRDRLAVSITSVVN